MRIWSSRIALFLLFTCLPLLGAERDYAQQIASLIDPAKLGTLRTRAANPRIQKVVYWLVVARNEGQKPSDVVARAVALARYTGGAAKLTEEALLRNLVIAERLGCTNEAGLADMRRGKSPTIMKGPYAGDELSVDHIIPRAIVPELDNVIANLELMPLRVNRRKSSIIGDRQRDVAKKLFQGGLLSRRGYDAVTQ